MKKEKNEIKEITVKFKNTYIGKLGNYAKNNIYTIPIEIYEVLKIDCKKV